MEIVNESVKLVATALEILKDMNNLNQDRLETAILYLEQAVDKLAK